MYGTKCWPIKNASCRNENVEMDVRAYLERWECSVVEKMREAILRWLRHVKRRCIDVPGKRCER